MSNKAALSWIAIGVWLAAGPRLGAAQVAPAGQENCIWQCTGGHCLTGTSASACQQTHDPDGTVSCTSIECRLGPQFLATGALQPRSAADAFRSAKPYEQVYRLVDQSYVAWGCPTRSVRLIAWGGAVDRRRAALERVAI